jgi:hypothetical protein
MHYPVHLTLFTNTVLFLKYNQTHHPVYLTPLTDTVLFLKHNQTHHPVYLTPLTHTVLFLKHNQTHHPVYLTTLTDTVLFFKYNQTHHPVYHTPFRILLRFKYNLHVKPHNSHHKSLKQTNNIRCRAQLCKHGRDRTDPGPRIRRNTMQYWGFSQRCC